ncbi:hypothetical protein Dimus_018906, partial [Dionaea muscipula]
LLSFSRQNGASSILMTKLDGEQPSNIGERDQPGGVRSSESLAIEDQSGDDLLAGSARRQSSAEQPDTEGMSSPEMVRRSARREGDQPGVVLPGATRWSSDIGGNSPRETSPMGPILDRPA